MSKPRGGDIERVRQGGGQSNSGVERKGPRKTPDLTSTCNGVLKPPKLASTHSTSLASGMDQSRAMTMPAIKHSKKTEISRAKSNARAQVALELVMAAAPERLVSSRNKTTTQESPNIGSQAFRNVTTCDSGKL